MHTWIKRTALALCLITALAAPAAAADAPPETGVHLISAPVETVLLNQVPSAVTVNGKTVAFDQGPAMVDGVLMVPVRAIAEAAGGVVTWAGEIRMVHVDMPDRTTLIRLDQKEAEMHLHGVTYPDRNRIAMAKQPVILNDRTLVSADALTAIFGFRVETGPDGSLQLTAPPAPPASVDSAVSSTAEQGSISQVKTGDSPSILLSGASMANGEPRLTWVSITPETKLVVQEGDQQRAGAVSDLQVGAKVAVTYSGPLMMSYPARGAAAMILVSK